MDIRMPPTHTDEGLVAAARIRANYPQMGVLVLFQYVEVSYALRLLEHQLEPVGGRRRLQPTTSSRSSLSSWTAWVGEIFMDRRGMVVLLPKSGLSSMLAISPSGCS